jgi:hypothetical protein
MRRRSLFLVGTAGWLAIRRCCSFHPQQRGLSDRRHRTVASSTLLFIGRPPPDQPFSHTYVEGSSFDDRTAEIEAMGGGKCIPA